MEIENLAGKWPNVAINPATGKTYESEHMDNGVSVRMCPNGSLQNLARHSKASQVFSDGFSDGENSISEQDTRENLERCLRGLLGLLIDEEPDPMTSGIYYNILGLLDRQEAITERKASERHEKFCAECEQVTDEQIDELTATCDALREQREHWFNEAVKIYRRFYPHDEYGIPQNIAEMVLAKVDELQATNKPNSQFDVLKTAETAENGASKSEIHDFDDSREQLEADIFECINARSWGMNHDYMISCLVEWLDRQAEISWDNAWNVQKDLIANMQDEIEYLRKVCQTQADSFAAIENENAALRSKLNRIRELAERLQDA